jgi:hypothetical protein
LSKPKILEVSTLYPNPASEQLAINLSDKFDFTKESIRISIYATDGRALRSFRLEDKKIIDISTLKPGNYLLSISNNQSNETIQFIKN